jgi:hypothetical protein
VSKCNDCSLLTVLRQDYDKKKVEKEGCKEKEIITVEVKKEIIGKHE